MTNLRSWIIVVAPIQINPFQNRHILRNRVIKEGARSAVNYPYPFLIYFVQGGAYFAPVWEPSTWGRSQSWSSRSHFRKNGSRSFLTPLGSASPLQCIWCGFRRSCRQRNSLCRTKWVLFFEITQYNSDTHNTHTHLWTHVHKFYLYEHLRRRNR